MLQGFAGRRLGSIRRMITLWRLPSDTRGFGLVPGLPGLLMRSTLRFSPIGRVLRRGRRLNPRMAPIDDPVALLRELMADDRADGRTFEQAWSENVTYVLERVRTKRLWREVFNGTEAAWRAAWYGQAGPGSSLNPDLLDDSRRVSGHR